LGVCTPPRQSQVGQKFNEVEAAAKTMLAFSAYLNSMRKASEESEAAAAGVKER
jgi:hypothetical protein